MSDELKPCPCSMGPAQPAEPEGAIQRPASHPAECYALGTHVVHASLVHGIVRQADELNAALSAVTAERDRLASNIERLTANPADHRYWEGRYRDEAAANDRLRAELQALRELVGQCVEYLNLGRQNSIASGSILHRSMAEAVEDK